MYCSVEALFKIPYCLENPTAHSLSRGDCKWFLEAGVCRGVFCTKKISQ